LKKTARLRSKQLKWSMDIQSKKIDSQTLTYMKSIA
jgi:hypothetical protein